MEYIKEFFLGYKTHKYKDQEFDLDISYVTDRILAMSFPGSGLEVIYRNSINDVAKFLNKKHKQNYLVIDLSETAYDYSKFNHQVKSFAWEDHHSPPINLLFTICQCIHTFLSADINNVVVIHCLAGKGRTGTMIACYLMYSGRFNDYKQILQYYKDKRFMIGGGVTQCSQIRYVQYFSKVLTSYIKTKATFKPVVVRLENIKMNGVPKFSSEGFRPRIQIYSVDDRKVIFSSEQTSVRPQLASAEKDTVIDIAFFPANAPILTGDIQFKVFHENRFGGQVQKAFRFAFNTSMVEIDKDMIATIRLGIDQLDPDKIKDDERFPPAFSVEIAMKVIDTRVKTQKSDINDAQFNLCVTKYKEEQKRWESTYQILSEYTLPTLEEAVKILFRSPDRDDVEKILPKRDSDAQKYVINSDSYQMESPNRTFERSVVDEVGDEI